ncbi:hypothetical protein GCM10027610_063530 [Dactylosporangium cerinum]
MLAGLVLAADLVPWPGGPGPVWGKVRALLTVAVRLALEIDSFAEFGGALVITRLDNGATVQLTGSRWEDKQLLTYVRLQLAELTAGEFLDRWGVDPAALRGGPGPRDEAGPRDGSGSQDGSRDGSGSQDEPA